MGLRTHTLGAAASFSPTFFNAQITSKNTAARAELVNCVPELAPFVVGCYGTRPTDVSCWMDRGQT